MRYIPFFAVLTFTLLITSYAQSTQHFLFYNLGEAYASPPDYDEAIKFYKLAINLNPKYAEAHYGIGEAYLNKGNNDSAMKYFEIAKTLKLDPNFYPKCSGRDYNHATQFCYDSNTYSKYIYNKCGGTVIYTPKTEACCGNSKYTLATQFCYNSIIYNKCSGRDYNPVTQFCSNSIIYNKCSGRDYNLATQFCYSDKIYDKCGGTVIYTPGTEACCGNSKYTTATQFCYNSVIYDKCGGTVIYNPGTEACCGNSKYTLATHYCSNGTIRAYGSVSYNNQTYKTIVVGTQTWMLQNINYNVSGSKCYGEGGQVLSNNVYVTLSKTEIQANCNKYGRLYNWATAMGLASNCNESSCASQIQSNHKGICPSGWHIPSNAEWDKLMTAVGGSGTAGIKLKATSGNGTDAYGFSALLGGYGEYEKFVFNGDMGYWWSATESARNRGQDIHVSKGSDMMYITRNDEGTIKGDYFFSIRCVQN